jgi:hypothetical protein
MLGEISSVHHAKTRSQVHIITRRQIDFEVQARRSPELIALDFYLSGHLEP